MTDSTSDFSTPPGAPLPTGSTVQGVTFYSYWMAVQPIAATATAGLVTTISSGATVSGSVVPAGFQQTVQRGGTAVDTIVSGGLQYVYGRASGSIVGSGSYSSFIYNGRQVVLSGGVAVGTKIGAGGYQTVSTGGKANFTSLEASLPWTMVRARIRVVIQIALDLP